MLGFAFVQNSDQIEEIKRSSKIPLKDSHLIAKNAMVWMPYDDIDTNFAKAA